MLRSHIPRFITELFLFCLVMFICALIAVVTLWLIPVENWSTVGRRVARGAARSRPFEVPVAVLSFKRTLVSEMKIATTTEDFNLSAVVIVLKYSFEVIKVFRGTIAICLAMYHVSPILTGTTHISLIASSLYRIHFTSHTRDHVNFSLCHATHNVCTCISFCRFHLFQLARMGGPTRREDYKKFFG